MMQLLELKERAKVFYQKNEVYLTPAIKFFFALVVFIMINKEIGYDGKLDRFPIVLILSLISAFTPTSIMLILAALVSTLHVYSISPILSVIVLMVMLILYLFFARYTPKLGYVLLAVPILFILKIPYVIPILLGMIATPVAIIPTACGIIIYYLFSIIKSAVAMQVNMTVEDILQLYTYVLDKFIGNKQMIVTIFIFSIMILVTYFVRRMTFDYAFEIAIMLGALTGILSSLISNFILESTNQIFGMLLGMIVSAAIVYAIHFFELTLDYSAVEYTQFEDDEYYYYVKAVPKVVVSAPQKNVKHISSTRRLYTDAEEAKDAHNEFDFYDD